MATRKRAAGKTIGVYLARRYVDEIERIAKRKKISASDYIRSVLESTDLGRAICTEVCAFCGHDGPMTMRELEEVLPNGMLDSVTPRTELALRENPRVVYVVECPRCGANGPAGDTKSAAVDRWNGRPDRELIDQYGLARWERDHDRDQPGSHRDQSPG